jgi:16S rRNA (adenine1518-N6/adenine1519-N6)-dimethyltransferase
MGDGTIGSIRKRLAERGLAPSKARGQNFLRSPDTARRIVECVGVTEDDGVVEIGPGLGDLTRAIASRARRVVAIEVDRGLVALLADEALPSHVEVRHQDVRRVDLGTLARELGDPVVLMGNLPYRLSGHLLGTLLGPRNFFRRWGFMLQSEVADRLLAAPGSSQYGPLAIWARLFSRAERRLELGPEEFVPRPRVRSTLVIFDAVLDTPQIADVPCLRTVVRTAFQYRRKTLRAALRGRIEGAVPALEAAGIDPGLRPARLSELDFVRLANALVNFRETP